MTVEPDSANRLTFGYQLREVLLLACTEVESSWSGILREHGYPEGHRWSTKDYVKLRDVLFLDRYEVALQSYPDYPPFRPFEGWDSSESTRSLRWYDAYNATKHNREANLYRSTLEHVLQAVGAAVVLFCAQFGFPSWTDTRQQTAHIRDVFGVVIDPPPAESAYIPLFVSSEDWQAMEPWSAGRLELGGD